MLTLLLPLSNYFTIFGETQGSTDVDLTSIDRVRVLCSKERGQKNNQAMGHTTLQRRIKSITNHQYKQRCDVILYRCYPVICFFILLAFRFYVF